MLRFECGPSTRFFFQTGNHVIRCAYLNGTIRTVAGVGGVSGSAGTGDGGPATAGKLNSPHSVAYDSVTQGFWITDSNNNAVRFVSSAGILSTVAGVGGTAGNTGDGGPASLALLSNPIGAVVDGSGGIFITGMCFSRQHKVCDTNDIERKNYCRLR